MDLKAPIDTAFIDQFGQEECVGFNIIIPFVSSIFGLLTSASLFFLERASMEGECSRSFSLRCVKRCLIQIGGYGWRM